MSVERGQSDSEKIETFYSREHLSNRMRALKMNFIPKVHLASNDANKEVKLNG